jgi:hypothetical protein
MKKGETHLRIINLGWPEMLWKSMDEYITFPDIQRSYSLLALDQVLRVLGHV